MCFERKFTVISNGYDFCCVFKIVGTEYFWRSPGCTKRRLVSCVTRASSHVAARYNAAVACTANKCIYSTGFSKKNRAGQIERGGYGSFYFSYGTDGPNSLEVNFGHRTCYFVNGYNNCYIWCFPISLHVSFYTRISCGIHNVRIGGLCGGSTVTLMDDHVRIILHSSTGRTLRPASIHWDGVKFYADAVVNTADEGQRLSFTPPRRLALHLEQMWRCTQNRGYINGQYCHSGNR